MQLGRMFAYFFLNVEFGTSPGSYKITPFQPINIKLANRGGAIISTPITVVIPQVVLTLIFVSRPVARLTLPVNLLVLSEPPAVAGGFLLHHIDSVSIINPPAVAGGFLLHQLRLNINH
jgi:hypothetical protein